MTFGSVCSGIEAASVAWLPLGMQCRFVAEIDPFCCEVLAKRYPEAPNLGDINAADFIERAKSTGPIDVLVGGPPCQSFSLAGLRGGLADPRGNLTLRYLAVVDALRPRWVVYENVPGILSSTSHDAPDPRAPQDDMDAYDGSPDGTEIVVEDEYDADESHAFSCLLAGLSELGYGWSYGSLDAQFFNLAQRRERVFVVGHLGAWQPSAAVLLNRESMSGYPAPSRQKRETVTGTLAARTRGGGGVGTDFEIGGGFRLSPPLTASGRGISRTGESRGQDCVIPILEPGSRTGKSTDDVRVGIGIGEDGDPMFTLQSSRQHGVFASTGEISHCLNAGGMGRIDYETETLVAHSPRAEGFDASEDGTGRQNLVPIAFNETGSGWWNESESAATIRKGNEEGQGGARESTLVAFNGRQDPDASGEITHQLDTDPHSIGIAFSCKDHGADAGDIAPTMRPMGHSESHANAGGQVAIGFYQTGGTHGVSASEDLSPAVKVGSGLDIPSPPAVAFNLRGRDGGSQPELCDKANGPAVRRLTVVEAARLQGFPDLHTHIERRPRKIDSDDARYYTSHGIGCWQDESGQWWTKVPADGPMYRAYGNSMATTVMAWIGSRIKAATAAMTEDPAA